MLAAANFKFSLDDGVFYGFFSGAGLQSLEIWGPPMPGSALPRFMPNSSWARRLHRLFEDYFSGERVTFDEIPLDLARGTPFQKAIWQAARHISYGDSDTYGGLARRIGKPRAARAVGNALGANPVCLVIPCHRVLAAQGAMGGYSAGLYWKQRLLQVERGGS